jgi:hypothetical protein
MTCQTKQLSTGGVSPTTNKTMAAPKNPNTAPARQARAKRKQGARAGTLDDVRAKLWACIERVEEIVQKGDSDASTVLKGTHALTQACAAYVKIIEAVELEARVTALEAVERARSYDADTVVATRRPIPPPAP